MSVARSWAVALLGLDGALVEVEADISSQLPSFTIIGLPDKALGEAEQRVRQAASNAGCPLSPHRITVNLSPASLPKNGSAFDLSIAMACLAAGGVVSAESVDRVVHIGELGLDGRLRPVAGVLAAVAAARGAGRGIVMVASGNEAEASLVPDMRVIAVPSLREAAIWHGAELSVEPVEAIPAPATGGVEAPELELADVIGQDDAVDALVVAAAGGHHLMMLGPPGSGKTTIAARLPALLPDLSDAEALEVTAVRSLSGLGIAGELVRRPPFESPHHTASAAAILGGGSRMIRPGSAVRASHGVLFLDEATEFQRGVLDALRQPLEHGSISIQRSVGTATFPARFQLVLAANPCPCGDFGSRDNRCSCPPMAIRRYLGRVSGPLLDRVDIRLNVARVTSAELRMSQTCARVTTQDARARVVAARARTAERLDGTPWTRSAEVPGSWLRSSSRRLAASITAPIDRALETGSVTMRGYDRVLKLAWTLADLDGADRPEPGHLGRALFLRKGIGQ